MVSLNPLFIYFYPLSHIFEDEAQEPNSDFNSSRTITTAKTGPAHRLGKVPHCQYVPQNLLSNAT